MIRNFISRRWNRRSSNALIKYLRKKGVEIGSDVGFYGDLRNISIDITRPSLVKIGNNVKVGSPFGIITHSADLVIFREKYKEIIGALGKVTIGNNVYIGSDVMILKGSKIGDNVIIGTKSLVTSEIPSNCVAVGIPAKKIMSLDELYEKRKKSELKEAREYALSIYETFKRLPVEEDFFEFFPLFLKRDDKSIEEFNRKLKLKMKREKRYPMSVEGQLGPAYENFLKSKPKYDSFEKFLEDIGLLKNEKKK